MPTPAERKDMYSDDFFHFFVGDNYGCPVDRGGKLRIIFDSATPPGATFCYTSSLGDTDMEDAWRNSRNGTYDERNDSVDGELTWNSVDYTFRIFRDRSLPTGAAPRIHVYMKANDGTAPDEGEWVGHGGSN